MDLFQKKNDLSRWLNCLSNHNWTRVFAISLLLKLSPRKLDPWFVLECFYPWDLSAEIDMLVFFTNSNLIEFQVGYLTLFSLFSAIDDFVLFWMRSLHKNIQFMLESLKAPSLVLHFSYHILMTFLIMVYVILLSMLMILLSNLSVIRHLIYLWQQLELASELGSDLQYTGEGEVEWKWIGDFNVRKT